MNSGGKKNQESAQAPAHFAALLEAWEPSPRLNEILGDSMSKRDKRRVVAVVQQYQFDRNTPDDSVARFRRLAAKEIAIIAPDLAPAKIEQLWAIPPQELFSQREIPRKQDA